jgi:hypothetical protein
MRVIDVVEVFLTILFYEIFKKLYYDFRLSMQIRNGTAYKAKDDVSSIVIRGNKEFIERMKKSLEEEKKDESEKEAN